MAGITARVHGRDNIETARLDYSSKTARVDYSMH